eukprot:CAMPEP_0115701636 /NCGR_PEP_ID=MMETSP0272-20121206/68078_1 /TAXON_ID=71861 /ORGANISM="Scrippsiella trochoidea, Strain CCMP3099" /LENGTH=45 /DNA_ID= /DNA_START= /DNA_END= /DNA_ORIENTATION=
MLLSLNRDLATPREHTGDAAAFLADCHSATRALPKQPPPGGWRSA